MGIPEATSPVDGFSVDVDSLSSDTNDIDDQSLPVDNTDRFLEEMESYWNDINSRLTVSRMVNDSVVKGIATAVIGEAAEEVSLKEAEIATLSERLQHYEPALVKENRLDGIELNSRAQTKTVVTQMPFDRESLDASAERSFYERFLELKFSAQEHIQCLNEGLEKVRATLSIGKSRSFASDVELRSAPAQERPSETLNMLEESVSALQGVLEATHCEIDKMFLPSKASRSIQQPENKLQKEANAPILHNLISELHADIEMKLNEQKILADTFNKDWRKTSDELSIMREELDAISTALSSELGLVHHNLETSEDWNNPKRKEHSSRIVLRQTSHSVETDNIQVENPVEVSSSLITESPQLKRLSSEELITFFKNEMTKIKRQHDSALQEKTEQLFALKREFLKEKGSNPLHFRRDKDLELRKKIIEIISKLDEILSKNKETSMLQNQRGSLLSLKQKINNLYIQRLSICKCKDAACITSPISDGNQTYLPLQTEEWLLEHYKVLEQNEILRTQENRYLHGIIKNEIESIVLTRLLDGVKIDMEDVSVAGKMVEDMCFFILKACIQDAICSMNLFLVKHCTDKDIIAATLAEKDKAVSMQMGENKKLRQESESLFRLLEDKERIMLETEFILIQEKEHNSLLVNEVDTLQYEVNKLKEENKKLRQETESLFVSLGNKEKLILETEFKLSQEKEQSSSCCSEINVLQTKMNKKKKENKNLRQERDTLFALLEEKEKLLSETQFTLIQKNEHIKLFSVELNTLQREMNKQNEEWKNLKLERESFFALLEEMEKLFLETDIRFIIANEQSSLFFSELSILHGEVNKQALFISEQKRESDSIKVKLEEMQCEVQEYQAKLSKTNKKLELTQHALVKEEKEKSIFQSVMEEKQMSLDSATMKEVKHANDMKSIISSMMQLSKAMLLFETTLSNKLEVHNSRLKSINNHYSQAIEQANFLKRKTCWYKQTIEARCSDLQKAETEVDLLGDEVDALLQLLEKIYIVLGHYYPVLQHYPGVVEIYKSIEREMRKDTSKLR